MVRLWLFLLCCLLVVAFAAAPAVAGPTGADQPQPAAPGKTGAKARLVPSKAGTPQKSYAGKKAPPRHPVAHRQAQGLHARPWAFGPADSSRNAWQKGLPSENLQQRAVGKKSGSVDTAAGINSALDKAQQEEKKRGGMNVQVADESASWRESPADPNSAPDENLTLESRHVVRAYADMAPSEDLSIGVSPELILKNEQRERPGNNRQPDSQLGLGMQFKLDF